MGGESIQMFTCRTLGFSNDAQNDGVMPYIDWAIANGFAVIDVNMPMHIDDPEVHISIPLC